ncbi:MAG: histidine--tRNA ligase [Ignavibacteria bacterium CG_4_8_14_3_um_filter_37_9]|nr:histidine--tRNA ligase [Ignavibacteria bacterium]OIO14012.1 MAG: histidine--tRNA ligase [Ignavibacteria bacterium CG1_02_37_35]PIS44046.1 MAG: histidine--tRNA ligase [Ignavibacteria bacterium CG08_land_8_20_14_0_20_37_9]PIW98672.1 MAG: histidine--tRNA ligase [Ignavibacteria bacterium CG_4_8_14_3_um_filter_37_9]PIX94669.1 MAG: histidine--tRNA ligase [Ignavibacteria bacterium CG_4_10_14_3_um_filter_37_18]PJC59364.1 MAG: histidine--tRNA ligase [Ignavibacteria bacterium CG_4_9_14_0_2_um_filter_
MLKAIYGTKDVLPKDVEKWNFLESTIKNIFASFNYKEIRTPLLEETGLFSRSIGEETDIVSKEMYTFQDRSETSITLRPEMTASVVRAFLEHSLSSQSSLNKLFYIAAMFRQERPQAGRFRQFHQFGAEVLGSSSPLLDAEIIILAYTILKSLGLVDITVKINSLGITSSRKVYLEILKEYLESHLNELSEESRKRFEKNVLRIFDSKFENDIQIMKDAPKLIDHLDDESKQEFQVVQNILRSEQIPFLLDSSLVRGLDYYSKTTFEIVSDKVGSQSALCGGGRYDGLIELLGGTPNYGVGFAAGIERILLALQNEKTKLPDNSSLDLYVVLLNKELLNEYYLFATALRKNHLKVEIDYLSRSVKAQMREANKLRAKFVALFGGEEYAENKVVLKNMGTSVQQVLPLENADKEILLSVGS